MDVYRTEGISEDAQSLFTYMAVGGNGFLKSNSGLLLLSNVVYGDHAVTC